MSCRTRRPGLATGAGRGRASGHSVPSALKRVPVFKGMSERERLVRCGRDFVNDLDRGWGNERRPSGAAEHYVDLGRAGLTRGVKIFLQRRPGLRLNDNESAACQIFGSSPEARFRFLAAPTSRTSFCRTSPARRTDVVAGIKCLKAAGHTATLVSRVEQRWVSVPSTLRRQSGRSCSWTPGTSLRFALLRIQVHLSKICGSLCR